MNGLNRGDEILGVLRELGGTARDHRKAGRIDASWACLEAAHMIGQRSTRLHMSTHWKMLQLAWFTRDTREIAGQALRLAASLAITWIWNPSGNSGRTHMSVIASAPLPRDLAKIIGDSAKR